MRLFERLCAGDEGGRKALWFSILFNSVGIPGLGSQCLGRRVGYAQMGLSLAGVLFLCRWTFEQTWNWVDALMDGTRYSIQWRDAALGVGLLVIAWIWATGTSLSVWLTRRKPSPPIYREPPVQ